ncbi:C39 family peptidase [Actinophytocola oryzae]|uniref:Peptidase C39-like protein n=1 Tax=Actinophytocola oryzae TaxID=502181 RepID=A0A4R7UZS9_9PSEU|nr:peptidase C39-like protein [Actinophytocola oryzae]
MRAHPLRLVAAGLGAALVMSLSAAPVVAEPAADDAPVDFHQWTSQTDFRKGRSEGVLPTPSGLVISRPVGTVEHTEPDLGTTRTYEYGRWTSPAYRQGFDATQLVASWNASTPDDTWLTVEMQGTTAAGAKSQWYTMGRWALKDTDIVRTTVPDQEDAVGYIDVDTFVATQPISSYQLRVTLYRERHTRVTPSVSMVGAMTSNIPDRYTAPAGPSAGAWGIELPVPRYSQNIHAGQYPQYGGGGEAWCSPTSTEMVVEYWGRRPSRHDLSWVDPAIADPTVPHAARHTYDHDYDGTGNWPFNTAYAASLGLNGHITRLSSLTDIERFIRAGIPVITSQSFMASELDGAGYGTSGHIMVVVGFTENGDVIANDPASSSNDAVRNVYKRDQFATIWLRTKRVNATGGISGGPGGVAYVIAPPWKRLPKL